MKEYGEEEVKTKLAEAMKIIKDLDYSQVGRFLDMKFPDTICLNCGRMVMVGKCCDTPNRVVMEKKTVSTETWDRIQEIINSPPEPTQELIDLMMRKPRYETRK